MSEARKTIDDWVGSMSSFGQTEEVSSPETAGKRLYREALETRKKLENERETEREKERESINGWVESLSSFERAEGIRNSETAGNRLYQKALESRKKLEKAREDQMTIEPPKLQLIAQKSGRYSREPSPSSSRFSSGRFSREPSPSSSRFSSGRFSREPSPSSSRFSSGKFSREPSPSSSRFSSGRYSREPSPSSPRYLQLYESAKLKNKVTPPNKENDFIDNLLASELAPNERCDHLYSLALPKQIKGKERREEIEKSKIKPPPPYLSLGKISAEDGAKLYDRGMHRVLKREMKLIEAAHKKGIEYKSPLLE